MAVGEVDREEWANIVRELMTEFTRGKKEPFARLAGVNPRTVHAWLDGAVAVTEASIRQVAERCEKNPMELLVRVGLYTLDQMPARPTHEEMDEERRRVIDDPDFDDVQKAYILQELDRMEEEDERVLAQLRERDRQRRIERLTTIIEQQRGA